MITIVKAPELYDDSSSISLFLGGSIDMGKAVDWQTKLTSDLALAFENSDVDIMILNPRRDDWDSSWIQDPTPGTKFYEQVDWELQAQENADGIVYYFSPESKASPITMLELGLFASSNVIVFCPPEFYRYGNVKMVCERYEIAMVESYDELLDTLTQEIWSYA